MTSSAYETKTAVCFGGNVDSGKSTLIGVLKGHNDDGRGSARKFVAKYDHEVKKGKTSAISTTSYKINDREAITLVDLAGHEQYFKTTAFGILSQHCDYAVVVVSSSAGETGITKMTQEHIRLLSSHMIPILFVMTRIDALFTGDVSIDVYKSAVNKLGKYLKSLNPRNTIIPINKFSDYQNFKKQNINMDICATSDKIISHLELEIDEKQTIFPMIIISNLDQFGIDVIKESFTKLKPRDFWKTNQIRIDDYNSKIPEQVRTKDNNDINGSIFYISDALKPNGLDIIAIGINRGDPITVEQKMFIGPINGKFHEVIVKSIRNNLNCREINSEERKINTDVNEMTLTSMGHHCRGCIQIKIKDDGTYKIKKNDLRKGAVIVSSEELKKNFYYRFKACISLDSDVYIGPKYTPVMNMANVKESIKITLSQDNFPDILKNNSSSDQIDKKILLSEERPYVFDCACTSKPVFMIPNTMFVIRGGTIKGRGMILCGYDITPDDKPIKGKVKLHKSSTDVTIQKTDRRGLRPKK